MLNEANKRKKIILSLRRRKHAAISLLLFLLFFGFYGTIYAAAGDLLINEIAPNGTADFSDNDWVEIYVKVGGNYTGYTIYEANTLVSSFSAAGFNPFTPAAGDYIVIHETGSWANSENDVTGKGANGYWDIWGGNDYTGTDNIISVRDAAGTTWVDAMGFSNRDNNATFAATAYNAFQTAGMWAEGPATLIDGTNDIEVEGALVTVPNADSSSGRNNISADTNLSADWTTQTTPSPGVVNTGGAVVGGGGSASIGDMLISEICVEGSSSYFSSNDWVEIYVVNSGNFSGCLLYEGNSTVKTFPSAFNPVAGDYIVIHEEAGTDETDATGKGANDYWDFYDCGDYTATDNIVSVRSPSGNWVDAMGFSDQDGDMTTTLGAAYDSMVSTNMWTDGPAAFVDTVNDALVQASLADYSAGGSNKSIVRLSTGTDTNTKSDWTVTSSLTPGTSSAITATSTSGRISAKITEVAPGISKGDFIEIFVTAASADVGGCKLYEDTTLIKTFPSNIGAIAKDIYIVLWASDNTSADETAADENGNGWIDLYSDETTSPGLTNTDRNITLKTAAGTIVDFMSFADDSATYSGSDTAYDAAVTAGQWSPGATSDAEYIAGSFGWSGSTSKSMYRIAENAVPKDTGRATDWTEGSTTIGYGDYGGIPTTTVKSLEIFQSPFSPYNDGTYRQAKFSYYLGGISGDYQVTLQVFDVMGRSVRILLDHVDGGGGSSTVSWDGRDDNGNVVRTGIYIVHIESLNKTTGSAKRTSQRVVVARKM